MSRKLLNSKEHGSLKASEKVACATRKVATGITFAHPRGMTGAIRGSMLRSVLLAGMGLGLLGGCNMITGADGLTVADDDDGDGSTGSGNPSSGQGGSGVGPSGTGVGQGGATTGQGGGGNVPMADMAPADGVSVDKVSIYQGVERELMEGGTDVQTNIPVVADRDAMLRVFYSAQGMVEATARLTIDGEEFVETVTLGGDSQNGDLGSTINFDVPATALQPGASYRVDILQPDEDTSGTNTAATYPTTAEQLTSLSVEKGGELDIVLVPVEMGGRLPDTSGAQVQRYVDGFRGMYPVEQVNISVRAAVTSSTSVSPNGNGWSTVLNNIADLRQADNVPASTYYYGILAPASSYSAYCSGGCVAGLGFVGGPSDDYTRASIGLGFTGDGSVETMLHELGHNHGRPHAPCGGASGPDPGYPYGGGGIGSWGLDVYSETLYSPGQFTDMMGYCNPTWISDYNFRQLFQRVQAVTGNNLWQFPTAQLDRLYQRAVVHNDGTITWLPALQMHLPPQGESTSVEVATTGGVETTTARFYRYDHLDGGILFVPPTNHPLVTTPGQSMLKATIDGQTYVTP